MTTPLKPTISEVEGEVYVGAAVPAYDLREDAMTTPSMKEILRLTASDREYAMTTPTPRTDALIRFEFGPTDQPFPAHALLAMIQLAKELERDLAAAQSARRSAEERAERNARLIDNIENALRKAGATLPAPEATGTIESAMNTALCIALCIVVNEREDSTNSVQRQD